MRDDFGTGLKVEQHQYQYRATPTRVEPPKNSRFWEAKIEFRIGEII
jgi:hypothetical protein